MKAFSKIISSFILIYLSASCLAQSIDTLKENRFLENILEDFSDETSGLFYKEELSKFLENPIEINTCSEDDLTAIPFLSPLDVRRIIDYQKQYGFKSVSQLKALLKNNEIYKDLLPFVKVAKFQNKNSFSFSSSSAINLQKSAGYNSVYAGSPVKSINKLKFSYENFGVSGGLLFDKDPGEENLYDFYSGYLKYDREKYSLILGDFFTESGQGLCNSLPVSVSKSAGIIKNSVKPFRGVKPYLSSMEYQFLRGAAVNTKFNNLNLSAFYSRNKIDASIDSLDMVGSVSQTGYHRTLNEINRKGNLKEVIFGGMLDYTYKFFRLGLDYYHLDYNKEFKGDQVFSFKGNKNDVFSFNYEMAFENIGFFGEFAKTAESDIAFICSSIIEPVNNMKTSIIYRRYPADFINFRASAFCENGSRNEEGIFFGIDFTPLNFIKINAYYDLYRFPFSTYYNRIPSSGRDCQIYLDFEYFKNHKVSLKYKYKEDEKAGDAIDDYGRNIDPLFYRIKQNCRIELSSILNDYIRFRGRVEWVSLRMGGANELENGILIFSDIYYKPMDALRLYFRNILFDTDSYYTGLYEYESEIDGIYNNIVLYGKGSRFYIMAEYYPNTFFTLAIKYSITVYDGIKSIGTGYDEVEGNFQNKVSFQFSIFF